MKRILVHQWRFRQNTYRLVAIAKDTEAQRVELEVLARDAMDAEKWCVMGEGERGMLVVVNALAEAIAARDIPEEPSTITHEECPSCAYAEAIKVRDAIACLACGKITQAKEKAAIKAAQPDPEGPGES